MSKNADDDPRRDKLLYRALATFSDCCDVPDLTPSCPFYILPESGVAICGEECKDILSDDLSYAIQDETLSLGGNLAAVRVSTPRPRRSAEADRPAFDVRQVYLTDLGRSLSNWRLTALTHLLRQHYSWMNDREHLERGPSLQEVEAELQRRGVDVESVVRQGLYSQIATAAVWQIVQAIRDDDDRLGWRAAARIAAPDGVPDEGDSDVGLALMDDVIHMVVRPWVLCAPLVDLADHRFASSDGELAALRDDLPNRDYEAVWFADRYSETYLDKWQQSSLHREWRYLHSMRAGCTSSAYMRERPIDQVGLAQALASVGSDLVEKRERKTDTAAPAMRSISVDQFKLAAVDALERGDFAEAVSVFELVKRVAPDDPEVGNGLGFCLLPSDPERAVRILGEVAWIDSPRKAAITSLNIALGHYLLGNYPEALAILTSFALLDLAPIWGWMWDLDAVARHEWVLATLEDIQLSYGSQLRHLIEERVAGI